MSITEAGSLWKIKLCCGLRRQNFDNGRILFKKWDFQLRLNNAPMIDIVSEKTVYKGSCLNFIKLLTRC